MLRIDRQRQSLSLLNAPKLSEVAITERYDLQEYIANSPEAFFAEVGERLFVVGREITPSKDVGDRIDLLCIDRDGSVVIGELKRGSNKLQLLQAVSYAGMLAAWSADEVVERLDDDQQEALADFLDCDVSAVNAAQRLLLIAEEYDYALLSAAEWLHEQFGVPIKCCRVALASDAATDSEYLTCSVVYPAPELSQQAVRRGRQSLSRKVNGKWPNWETALASTENQEARDAFAHWLEDGCEQLLRYRRVRFRIRGKVRFFCELKQKGATAVQRGRFQDDLSYWQSRLSEPGSIKERESDTAVRFHLRSRADFQAFSEAVNGALVSVDWSNEPVDESEYEAGGTGGNE